MILIMVMIKMMIMIMMELMIMIILLKVLYFIWHSHHYKCLLPVMTIE